MSAWFTPKMEQRYRHDIPKYEEKFLTEPTKRNVAKRSILYDVMDLVPIEKIKRGQASERCQKTGKKVSIGGYDWIKGKSISTDYVVVKDEMDSEPFKFKLKDLYEEVLNEIKTIPSITLGDEFEKKQEMKTNQLTTPNGEVIPAPTDKITELGTYARSKIKDDIVPIEQIYFTIDELKKTFGDDVYLQMSMTNWQGTNKESLRFYNIKYSTKPHTPLNYEGAWNKLDWWEKQITDPKFKDGEKVLFSGTPTKIVNIGYNVYDNKIKDWYKYQWVYELDKNVKEQNQLNGKPYPGKVLVREAELVLMNQDKPKKEPLSSDVKTTKTYTPKTKILFATIYNDSRWNIIFEKDLTGEWSETDIRKTGTGDLKDLEKNIEKYSENIDNIDVFDITNLSTDIVLKISNIEEVQHPNFSKLSYKEWKELALKNGAVLLNFGSQLNQIGFLFEYANQQHLVKKKEKEGRLISINLSDKVMPLKEEEWNEEFINTHARFISNRQLGEYEAKMLKSYRENLLNKNAEMLEPLSLILHNYNKYLIKSIDNRGRVYLYQLNNKNLSEIDRQRDFKKDELIDSSISISKEVLTDEELKLYNKELKHVRQPNNILSSDEQKLVDKFYMFYTATEQLNRTLSGKEWTILANARSYGDVVATSLESGYFPNGKKITESDKKKDLETIKNATETLQKMYEDSKPKDKKEKSSEKELSLEDLKASLKGAKLSVKYLTGKEKTDVETWIKGLEVAIKYYN